MDAGELPRRKHTTVKLLHDELVYTGHLILLKWVNKDYNQPETGERTNTQNFDGVESFGHQTPAIMKTKSNHFLCICISQKNSMTFSCTHYARRSLKTGYAIDPYCVKGKIHRGGSTVIALLFLYLCTRLGLVFNTMPWPIYPPGNDPVPIVYETEWALGRVWMGVENIDPNGIGSLDHPVRNELLYQVHYPCPPMYCVGIHNWGPSDTNHLTSWHNCTGMHTLHIIIVKVLEPTEN